MEIRRVQLKGVLSWVGLLGSSCRYTRFLSCLGCSSRPCTKYFFSPYSISIHLSPLPSRLGRQSSRFTCLLICVSGLLRPSPPLPAHSLVSLLHNLFSQLHPAFFFQSFTFHSCRSYFFHSTILVPLLSPPLPSFHWLICLPFLLYLYLLYPTIIPSSL